jgi:hypothetical protein
MCLGALGGTSTSFFIKVRLGGARMRSAVTAFAEFTAEQGLMDLPLSGGGVYVV